MNNLSSYKNIIFDLGGVILTINYQKTIDEFSKLVGDKFDIFYTQYKQLSFFDEFEKGEISPSQFRAELRNQFEINASDCQIDFAWNALLGIIPPERIVLLKKLSKNNRIFLLSNTNEIHLNEFNKIILNDNGIVDFTSFFEHTYFSHQIGMRKPDTEIFEFVLNKNNLNASETLFIDDSTQHIESAKKLGIATYLLDRNSITTIFEK